MNWTEGSMRRTVDGNRRSRADYFFSALDYRMLVPVLALVMIGLVVLNNVLASGYGAAAFEYPIN
jgi:hypothetical protein